MFGLVWRSSECPNSVLSVSIGDFLLDKKHSKGYYVDSEEWWYTTFCDAFSLGYRILGLSVDPDSDPTSQYPKGLFVTAAFFGGSWEKLTYLPLECDTQFKFLHSIIQYLCIFIRGCFILSPRKDQLIKVVRESIEKGIWYPCLQDLDNWSDWERFAALELFLTIIDAQHDVRTIHFFFQTSHLMMVLHTGQKPDSDEPRSCHAAEDNL